MRRWTTRQLWMAGLGLAAVAAVIATGALSESTPDDPGAVGSGVASDLDPPEGPAAPPGRTVITLGDLDPLPDPHGVGAPYDPCTVIGWADLPATVRPAAATRSSPQRPGTGDEFTIGCRFDNSGPLATDDKPLPGGGTGVFTVTVVWGTAPPLSLNPATYPGAAAATFAGRPGLQRSSTNPEGHRTCTGLMPVTGGVAGATVTNSRFPQTDPCLIAAAALTAIAAKVP